MTTLLTAVARPQLKPTAPHFLLLLKLLAPSIRQHIYNIYGFVRFADEIVDSFMEFPQEQLLISFENELQSAIQNQGSVLIPY